MICAFIFSNVHVSAILILRLGQSRPSCRLRASLHRMLCEISWLSSVLSASVGTRSQNSTVSVGSVAQRGGGCMQVECAHVF
jgi:hypothetical protein